MNIDKVKPGQRWIYKDFGVALVEVISHKYDMSFTCYTIENGIKKQSEWSFADCYDKYWTYLEGQDAPIKE